MLGCEYAASIDTRHEQVALNMAVILFSRVLIISI